MLVDVQAGNWPLTLALYEQHAALLRFAGMKYKLLTHLYTYSTLLYVRCPQTLPSALQPCAAGMCRTHDEHTCLSSPVACARLAHSISANKAMCCH